VTGEFIIYERMGGFSVDLKRLLDAKRVEVNALLQRQHEALRFRPPQPAEPR